MVTDGKDQVYFLNESNPLSFSIHKLNIGKDTDLKLEPAVSFNSDKFDFEYKDDNGISNKFDHKQFIPKNLFYDQQSDRLFVVGSVYNRDMTMYYQVYPSVKLIAWDKSGDFDGDIDFIQPSDDGQTFYISSTLKNMIYAVHEGERISNSPHFCIDGDRANRFIPLLDKGRLFVLDLKNKMMKEVSPDPGTRVVATL